MILCAFVNSIYCLGDLHVHMIINLYSKYVYLWILYIIFVCVKKCIHSINHVQSKCNGSCGSGACNYLSKIHLFCISASLIAIKDSIQTRSTRIFMMDWIQINVPPEAFPGQGTIWDNDTMTNMNHLWFLLHLDCSHLLWPFEPPNLLPCHAIFQFAYCILWYLHISFFTVSRMNTVSPVSPKCIFHIYFGIITFWSGSQLLARQKVKSDTHQTLVHRTDFGWYAKWIRWIRFPGTLCDFIWCSSLHSCYSFIKKLRCRLVQCFYLFKPSPKVRTSPKKTAWGRGGQW